MGHILIQSLISFYDFFMMIMDVKFGFAIPFLYLCTHYVEKYIISR